jgi:type II secretory ATPase GspE/PulE/Tfp pilus assembly ATPase PilB-like protein
MPKPESLIAMGMVPEDWSGMGKETPFRRGRGCEKCQQSGFKGRVGLYELFVIDEQIRRYTVERASSSVLKEHAIRTDGMRTLLGDGRLAVLDGKTTPEEVLRVCQREAL